MSLASVTPVLRIFDERLAKEFYVEFLGFNIMFEHRFEDDLPLYMAVSRDDCVLHLTEHHGDACPGSAIRVEVMDIEALHAELTGKKYNFYRPEVQDMPWGGQDMQVLDPFGNKITFSSTPTTWRSSRRNSARRPATKPSPPRPPPRTNRGDVRVTVEDDDERSAA